MTDCVIHVQEIESLQSNTTLLGMYSTILHTCKLNFSTDLFVSRFLPMIKATMVMQMATSTTRRTVVIIAARGPPAVRKVTIYDTHPVVYDGKRHKQHK